jgi:hypothetical protein
MMTSPKFRIPPSFGTYGLLMVAEGRSVRGIDSLLHCYDLWSDVLALAGHGAGDDAPKWLAAREPALVESLEFCLLRTRIVVDSKLARYVKALVRAPQIAQSGLLGGFVPQGPTKVPLGSLVAVLAADVLVNIDALFEPLVKHFSAVVIPYSQIALLRTRVTRQGTVPARDHASFSVLRSFLSRHAARVHLISLEEELSMSADFDRVAVGCRHLAARPGGVAMALARGLETASPLYAQAGATFYVVTTNFYSCGRFVVENPRCRSIVKLLNPAVSPDWDPLRTGDNSSVSTTGTGMESVETANQTPDEFASSVNSIEKNEHKGRAEPAENVDEPTADLLMQLMSS